MADSFGVSHRAAEQPESLLSRTDGQLQPEPVFVVPDPAAATVASNHTGQQSAPRLAMARRQSAVRQQRSARTTSERLRHRPAPGRMVLAVVRNTLTARSA